MALPQEAAQVPQVLDNLSVPFVPIAEVNWPDEYPLSNSNYVRAGYVK